MNGFRLNTGRGTLFAAILVVALIVTLPLRLALAWFGVAEAGMTAREVTGSIWSGRLVEARFGQIALGELAARVAPLPLLIGHARIELAAPDGAAGSRLSGAIDVTRHDIGLSHVTASLPVGNAFSPVPVTTLELDDVSVGYAGDTCERAEGRVRALLTGDVAGQRIPTTMSSPAGEGSTIRIWRDGRYRTDLTLTTSDPAQVARLQGFGFVQTPQGMQLAIEGRF